MDIHGNLDYLKYFINTGVGFPQRIFNSCIVLCGDVGLGFSPDLESMKISFLNKLCEKTNNYIIAIRGNHDDPQQFKNLYNKRFKAIEDYSVIQYKDKNILCIGGGTSIDRIYRKNNKWGYWEDEKIVELDNFDSIPYCQIIASYLCIPLWNRKVSNGILWWRWFITGRITLGEKLSSNLLRRNV